MVCVLWGKGCSITVDLMPRDPEVVGFCSSQGRDSSTVRLNAVLSLKTKKLTNDFINLFVIDNWTFLSRAMLKVQHMAHHFKDKLFAGQFVINCLDQGLHVRLVQNDV